MNKRTSSSNKKGYFGEWGGQFIPETLMPPLLQLEDVWQDIVCDREYIKQLEDLQEKFIGRPTPLYKAENLSEILGFNLHFKREDLCHTGAHKINNSIAQVLLAKFMGKKKVIAETGAGQHGVATASAAARLGLECIVYMGEKDTKRQRLNLHRMELMGATVHAVSSGSGTLKAAMSEALRDWVSCAHDTHYVIGSAAGPHPYPQMVANFQSVIGREVRKQFTADTGLSLPNSLVACVGGGSNAIGLFSEFIEEESVELVGVEAAGNAEQGHSKTITEGKPGVLHGFYSLLLQDEHGQVLPTHSVSAGLDYPGVGPEHAHLHRTGRAQYYHEDDAAAIAAVQTVSKYEGILPALETAHALAWALRQDGKFNSDYHMIVNLSGRGDKDIDTLVEFRNSQTVL